MLGEDGITLGNPYRGIDPKRLCITFSNIDHLFTWYAYYGVILYFQSDAWVQWRHNERDSVSNHQPHDSLFNCLLGRRSKKTSKLRVTGLCSRNSPVTGEFPAQRVSNAENVSIWWRHHALHFWYTNTNMVTYWAPWYNWHSFAKLTHAYQFSPFSMTCWHSEDANFKLKHIKRNRLALIFVIVCVDQFLVSEHYYVELIKTVEL